MKKTLFVLSAVFLVASPVLAGGWDEAFSPPDQTLTIRSQESEGVEFATDRLEVVSKDQEPGFLGKIGGFAFSTAQKVVETPVKFLGQFIGRKQEKPAGTASEASTLSLHESETWTKLDPNSVPDFSLKVNAKPVRYSVFEKSEGKRLANIGTSEKKGQDSKMLQIQILLQDIVSTDEK